ncbi:hypothetical protein Y032_0187g1126 [Ancylostoma ceylanicum]|uniref:Acyltransferase 3 domain-containing protein n=1 Tax=Ancylostoma ceylanicum TaxID=53326 RepID=A0A016SRW3_9BILA|nr:hypothetical protein Y032_0187g1126 [Ancylostoma ceylanicum]
MDHPVWKPLGRLSYCGYIVHFFIIHYVFDLDDRPSHYVSIWQTYIYRVIPVVVLSYIFAFIWSCLFEVPVVKLEKMLIESISPAKKEVKPNHNINNNPHERIYAYDKQQKEPYQIRF